MIDVVKCDLKDIPVLAALNQDLHEDEAHDLIPTIDALEEKLYKALNNDSDAYFFIIDRNIVGYALVKRECFPNYLSHFYICRDQRKNHIGTESFNKLLDVLDISTIDLDVFVWNSRGQAFWKSLGFKERCIIMRKSKP